MHELSIAQNIIEIVEDNIKTVENPKVNFVFLKVGKLSNVLVDSLTFGFDTLIQGTNLEGAKLLVEEIPIKLNCKNCEKEFETNKFAFQCIYCGNTNLEMLTGNELTVSEIDVE
jgi:hydrogenase nickel incorporation protein HypA/HybF